MIFLVKTTMNFCARMDSVTFSHKTRLVCNCFNGKLKVYDCSFGIELFAKRKNKNKMKLQKATINWNQLNQKKKRRMQ